MFSNLNLGKNCVVMGKLVHKKVKTKIIVNFGVPLTTLF